MKKKILCILGSCWVALSSFAQATTMPAPVERPPNVLILITDDQGFGDFGFLGNTNVETPHMDKLASQSARFENFMVHAACSPTRAAFMTGRHHLRTGVWGVGARNAQREDEVIMPAFFKAGGYETGYFGKRDGM